VRALNAADLFGLGNDDVAEGGLATPPAAGLLEPEGLASGATATASNSEMLTQAAAELVATDAAVVVMGAGAGPANLVPVDHGDGGGVVSDSDDFARADATAGVGTLQLLADTADSGPMQPPTRRVGPPASQGLPSEAEAHLAATAVMPQRRPSHSSEPATAGVRVSLHRLVKSAGMELTRGMLSGSRIQPSDPQAKATSGTTTKMFQ
jgi:hypothetical protein